MTPPLTALAEQKITHVYCFIDWFWKQHVDNGLFPFISVGRVVTLCCRPKIAAVCNSMRCRLFVICLIVSLRALIIVPFGTLLKTRRKFLSDKICPWATKNRCFNKITHPKTIQLQLKDFIGRKIHNLSLNSILQLNHWQCARRLVWSNKSSNLKSGLTSMVTYFAFIYIQLRILLLQASMQNRFLQVIKFSQMIDNLEINTQFYRSHQKSK